MKKHTDYRSKTKMMPIKKDRMTNFLFLKHLAPHKITNAEVSSTTIEMQTNTIENLSEISVALTMSFRSVAWLKFIFKINYY